MTEYWINDIPVHNIEVHAFFIPIYIQNKSARLSKTIQKIYPRYFLKDNLNLLKCWSLFRLAIQNEFFTHFLMLWNVNRKVLALESVFNKALASNVLQELFNSFFDIARETIFENAHGGLVLCIFESGAQGKTFVVLLVHFNQNPYLLPLETSHWQLKWNPTEISQAPSIFIIFSATIPECFKKSIIRTF